MSGSMVTFQANGRTADGYLVLPPSGAGPGLLVIQEWWGLVDHIKSVAERFAKEGFVALAPDIYHGERTTSPDQAGKLLMALNIAEAGKDLRGAASYLRSHAAVTPKKVGALGFCMGGQLALFAAQEHPDVIDASVVFYGIHPKVTIEPARVKVPVLGHFALKDTSVPIASARALSDAVQKAGGSFELHEYDAGHAFFNDTRVQVYDPACAKVAWERTLGFLRGRLR
ncbi:MAG TPA: dienelactone hydrolase family protein [Gemmatimonadaceae bacterium]|nr:dienelactone hydrolase family protein [Gemmatimonadaceae bacterium]